MKNYLSVKLISKKNELFGYKSEYKGKFELNAMDWVNKFASTSFIILLNSMADTKEHIWHFV